MSILKIKDICLCTGLVKDNNGNRSAYDFLTENYVPFRHLAYWDINQHEDVFNGLKTWDPTIENMTFPIVHYHEVDSDFNIKGVILVGLDQITSSNIVELSKL